jgi:NTP pyrophosphatase (non-canonical NTP hydrolase)
VGDSPGGLRGFFRALFSWADTDRIFGTIIDPILTAETMSNFESTNDAATTMQDLRKMVRNFVEERDWRQFHSPKNLSMALAIEAAELMEHFQWITPDASRQLDNQAISDVGEELADVLCYALAIANELDLDLSTALKQKMVKNREKYPVNEYRGRFGKDDPSPVSEL